MANEGENVEEETDFIFLGSKITVDSDSRHEIKRCLLLGRKAMTNLDSILKIRDITLTIKTFAGKTMVFPVVRFRCEYLCLVAQSCPTACNPMDSSLPGSSAHGILQARILECVVISFSRGSSQSRDQTQVSSIVGIFFTIWATREAQHVNMGVLGFEPRVSCMPSMHSTTEPYLQAELIMKQAKHWRIDAF